MKVTTKGHTTIIRNSNDDLDQLLLKISNEHTAFKGQNLIIDLSHHGLLDKKEVLKLQPLSKNHKKNKKSFVVVVADTEFNDFPNHFIVVPSVLEAHDIIEMEEIERDLGF